MQVARTFFLTREKTFARKLSEVLLAFKIEANLTKDQILELYINQIFLGQRAYGFAAAANIYFGKDLKSLTPAEAAMLAGPAAGALAPEPAGEPEARPAAPAIRAAPDGASWAGCRPTSTRRRWPSPCG